MTPRQKIELRRSEARKRLGEIAALEGDALTDEVREERGNLMTELRESEDQLQAAITAEGEERGADAKDFEEAARREAETPEEREFRELQDGAELRDYASALADGRALTGQAAELNAAIFERQAGGAVAENRTKLLAEGDGVLVPWSALAPRTADLAGAGSSATAIRAGIEGRADAASSLPAAGVQTGERDFIGRVLVGGGADFLQVRRDTVEMGEATHFVLSAGASPASLAAGAEKDAEAATLTGIVMEPHRLSAAYTMRIEDLARSMRYEPGLRRDLSEAAREAVDNIILNGATGIDGLLSANVLAAAEAANAVPTRTTAVRLVADAVDGRYARNLAECRALIGDESYRVLAGLLTDASESSAADYLLARSGGLMASALLPAPDGTTKIQAGVIARVGVMNNAVAAFWDMAAMTIVRDEYTRANRGEIRLQLNMLWDFRVLRADGFRHIQIKTAA